jgi:predicted MPP superfamily phosphohydrolase
VSRGTAYWGVPMRLLAPAEVTEVVLRSPALLA